MLKQILFKLKESFFSVLPVIVLVSVLTFTPLINFSLKEYFTFFISSLFLIIGISFFNIGAELSMSPMGEQVGSSLIKSKNLKLAFFIIFIMGVFITIAEPDLSVLASQVKDCLNSTLMMIFVGLGVGLFLILGIMKIIFKNELSPQLLFFYLLVFAFTCIVFLNEKSNFLALAFDAGGVTTGPITVPFIMALGLGVSQTIGGRKAKDNSFGLIALCSIGPILIMLLMSLNIDGNINFSLDDYFIKDKLFLHILLTLLHSLKEVSIALGLISFFFFILQITFIKLPKTKIIQILVGLCFTLSGLVLFLTAAKVGFMPTGFKIGQTLSSIENKTFLIIFGFIIGLLVVFAEPAVIVLTHQVEEVTTGGISKRSMLISLGIGVGISLTLSLIRIIYDFSILWYLIPGYIISLGLSFFIPKVYTAIAFDSGGVSSGPLTSTFILPIAIGTCIGIGSQDKIIENAFGIVAMVSLTPLITIQLLGFKDIVIKIINTKKRTKQILSADDEQIIYFN